jgi:hypothetical protein
MAGVTGSTTGFAGSAGVVAEASFTVNLLISDQLFA